jgi:Phosphatidylinositol-glycan biosynthesis class S protein
MNLIDTKYRLWVFISFACYALTAISFWYYTNHVNRQIESLQSLYEEWEGMVKASQTENSKIEFNDEPIVYKEDLVMIPFSHHYHIIFHLLVADSSYSSTAISGASSRAAPAPTGNGFQDWAIREAIDMYFAPFLKKLQCLADFTIHTQVPNRQSLGIYQASHV